MFKDRKDAGRQLAERLRHLRGKQTVILGLPRGGMPVAFEVAAALECPLDVMLVRRIQAPDNPEHSIGAVVDSHAPHAFISRDAVERIGLSDDAVRQASQSTFRDVERLRNTYLAGKPRIDVRDRTVIVVDDGAKTGAALRVALRALRTAHPARLVAATPIVPRRVVERLQACCDELVALATPEEVGRISFLYDEFGQIQDSDVIDLLERAATAYQNARIATG